jgi:hypothetical protein
MWLTPKEVRARRATVGQKTPPIAGIPHPIPEMGTPVAEVSLSDSTKREDKKQSLCVVCGTVGAPNRKCSVCRSVYYCSEVCQQAHWREHKSVCKARAL